jgi:hypothetical protein
MKGATDEHEEQYQDAGSSNRGRGADRGVRHVGRGLHIRTPRTDPAGAGNAATALDRTRQPVGPGEGSIRK